jgi:seryl-tRNA synthetase
MKLYDMANDLQVLREGGIIINEETGEILYDGTNIDKLEASMAEKVEGVLYYADKRDNTAEVLRKEAKRLTDWAKTLENESARLKAYALDQVKKVGKIETEHYRVGTRKSKAVEILDAEKIPLEYLTPQPPKIDKRAIKEALESGKKVRGAAIVINENLSVR